jgi:hypothetical protein
VVAGLLDGWSAQVRSGGVQGRWKRRIDGLGGPVVGLAELIHIFFFFLFDLPRRATNRRSKGHIYRDLCSEAVRKTVSVNTFCPPQLTFFVVVNYRTTMCFLFL